jgi:hypothetical protein
LTTDVLAERSGLEPDAGFVARGASSAAASHRNEVIEETAMTILSKDTQQRSAAAAVKAERALDKVAAMQEYEAEALALRANTERLRALRLAREAESKQNLGKHPPAKQNAAPGLTLKEPQEATRKKRVPPAKRAASKSPEVA